MSEKIEPAVSAKIWEEVANSPWPIDSYIADTPDGCAYLMALNNHALPDGNGFKFVREDVALLREIAAAHAAESDAEWSDIPHINALADRIEALLPPE